MVNPMISITYGTTDDFQVIQVDTGALSLALMPELGGKVSSLRDKRSGREWLWRNPRIPYQRVAHGASYGTNGDTGGWDECFPTVAPCDYPSPPWRGAAVQDHGELWSQSVAQDVQQNERETTLVTHWQGSALPYAFQRAIKLNAESARVRLEYTATNNGDAPMQSIWSAHPLLAIEPGMRLVVPPSARFHKWVSVPADLSEQASGLSFPFTARGIDLTTLPDASAAIALKLWSGPLDEGWATLIASDGEFRLRWDAAQLPQVGFWMNLGAWAGDAGAPYYNLGLEPCIGAQDSLAEAVTRYNLFLTLPPHESRAWWLEVELNAQGVTTASRLLNA